MTATGSWLGNCRRVRGVPSILIHPPFVRATFKLQQSTNRKGVAPHSDSRPRCACRIQTATVPGIVARPSRPARIHARDARLTFSQVLPKMVNSTFVVAGGLRPENFWIFQKSFVSVNSTGLWTSAKTQSFESVGEYLLVLSTGFQQLLWKV